MEKTCKSEKRVYGKHVKNHVNEKKRPVKTLNTIETNRELFKKIGELMEKTKEPRVRGRRWWL